MGSDEEVGGLSPEDRALLTRVQDALPLVERPFRALGEELGLSEGEVLSRLTSLQQAHIIRRIGPVFEPAALGLASELVAAEVGPDHLDAAGHFVSAWPEVTHCYAREHRINLWFAGVAASREWFAQAAVEVARREGVRGVWRLPTVRRFKIEVRFDLEGSGVRGQGSGTARGSRTALSGELRRVLPALGAALPVVAKPFAALGAAAGLSEEQVLSALEELLQSGALRRYGALVSHRRLGFLANAMTVWEAREEQLDTAGAVLAASPHVSHCYSRPAFAEFPYTLYAMLHARTREECLAVAADLTAHAGLPEPRALFSTVEYKKSAPDYAHLLR